MSISTRSLLSESSAIALAIVALSAVLWFSLLGIGSPYAIGEISRGILKVITGVAVVALLFANLRMFLTAVCYRSMDEEGLALYIAAAVVAVGALIGMQWV